MLAQLRRCLLGRPVSSKAARRILGKEATPARSGASLPRGDVEHGATRRGRPSP
jgi:hypothetical protein